MHKKKEKIKFKNVADLPVKITDWIGSTSSILIHSIFFIGVFTLRLFGYTTNDILLILTTAVSLEAIYLAIFIQMTVNRNTQSLEEVEEDIEEISEEVTDMEKDIDLIQEDIDKLEEDNKEETVAEKDTALTLSKIEDRLRTLAEDVAKLKDN